MPEVFRTPLCPVPVQTSNVRSHISIIIQLLPPTFRGRLRLRGGRDAHCVWREILATGPPPPPQLSPQSTIPMCLAQRRGSDFCRERLSRLLVRCHRAKQGLLEPPSNQLAQLHSVSIIAPSYLGKPNRAQNLAFRGTIHQR